MFTFEYRFYPKATEEPESDEFEDTIHWFMAMLYKNGQMLWDYHNMEKADDSYICRVVAPEKISLESKLYNEYCKECFHKIENLSKKLPELVFIGENYDAEDCCVCKESSHYILDGDLSESESPVICGDCGRPAPLYRFPKTNCDTEYFDILNWQNVYRACWQQFLQGIGERHGYRMLHSYKSELAVEGRRICTDLEIRIQKPVYYFLFQYYSNNRKTCCCGGPWVNLNKSLLYDYVCQQCRLVSND